jgi:predicted nucleic acid-binding protein
MGKARVGAEAQVSITFDTGALIALERGNSRMIALLQAVVKGKGNVHLPAGVAGQAWRGGARQAVLARFLASPQALVQPLDLAMAQACGELCAVAGTSDIIDASVVITARMHGDGVVTSDVEALRRLDPKVHLERI